MMINPTNVTRPVTVGKTSSEKPTAEQQQLMKACNDFEAMMTRQMLEVMQKSTKMFGEGFGGDYYQSMFQDEISKMMTQNGLGWGKMLYQQISRTNNVK